MWNKNKLLLCSWYKKFCKTEIGIQFWSVSRKCNWALFTSQEIFLQPSRFIMWPLVGATGIQHSVYYGLLVTCKLNCVCVYLHWTGGWAPRWGWLWLPHVPSFPLPQIYWQSMDTPLGSLYSALDLLGYPTKRTSILRMTDLDECGIRMKYLLHAFLEYCHLTAFLQSSIKLKAQCSNDSVMAVTVFNIQSNTFGPKCHVCPCPNTKQLRHTYPHLGEMRSNFRYSNDHELTSQELLIMRHHQLVWLIGLKMSGNL